MFNLERAISKWRRQLAVGGIDSHEALDELESHLREEIREQMAAGMSGAQAFAVAVERLGDASALKTEFRKLGPFNREFLRKLKGFLLGRSEIPFPSLENFAPNTRQALQLAPDEARRFKHDFIGTEHLLLSLTQVRSGAVANVMHRLGLDPDSIRMEIEKLVGNGTAKADAAKIPFTPRAKRALQLALNEASAFNQKWVRPEHVFLGLLLEGEGVAALVLKKLGVQIEKAREEVLKGMRSNPDAC
jgi:hypothetical protein